MQRFENILCIVASEPDEEEVLSRAARLALRHGARLTLMEVIDTPPPDTRMLEQELGQGDLRETMTHRCEKRLKRLAAGYRMPHPVRVRVAVGMPFLEIIREVLRQECDLVVKRADRGGLLERLFGSDDMHLLRKCPCPVWLLRPGAPERYRTLLAAVDVSDGYPADEQEQRHRLNLRVLEIAYAMAQGECADLHVVHAWEAVGESALRHALVETPQEKLEAYVEAVGRRHDRNLERLLAELESGRKEAEAIPLHRHLLKGAARREIPALAHEIGADLVVMGTVARTGIPGLFIGNTAETILNRLDCSVLAVKPPGFSTPVQRPDDGERR